MKSDVLVAAFACIALACGRNGEGARAPAALASDNPSHPVDGAAAGAKTSGRSLVVQLTFDAGRLRVRIAATGLAADLRGWQLGEDAVDHLEVRDGAEHALPFERKGRAVEIAGAGGAVALAYDVVSAAPVKPPVTFESAEAMDAASRAAAVAIDEEASATVLEPARFRAVGERILALPTAFESKAVTVSLDVRGGPDARVVATSFGIAKEKVARSFESSGATLRRAAFLGGPGGRAEFDAVEGHDEAAWLGYPAFDPRAVSAEVAGFRGVLHDYFKDFDLHPATLFFFVDPRPRGHFRVMRRASGVLVALGNDPYDAPLRLAVGHELVHAWIGERIWLGDPSPGREAETFWFHEGFTRWIAREQLARVGLLSSDEYAAEIDRLLAIVTTSRHGARSMKELVADRATTGVVPLLVARGALYATVVDARIREASHGARSLDDVVRALAKQAAERRGALPEGALHDLLVAELGEARTKEDFDDVVLAGRRARLPDTALGACFESRDVAYDVYAPGFDVAASRAAHAVVGLDPKGPAAAAGVREHEVLLGDDVPDRTDQPAKLQVERGGKPVLVTYRPTSGTKRGQGFRRKPALTEEACRKLALRR